MSRLVDVPELERCSVNKYARVSNAVP